jgi:hypothetical protein
MAEHDHITDDEWERERAEEAADQLRKQEPAPALSASEFLELRGARRGTSNPCRLDNALWHWQVRTRWNAYQANQIYKGPSPFDAGPMWSFDRFGTSETLLPDGRTVHIAGEHEDYYDPDFFIYNDVIVIDRDGTIAIYGYPEQDFPPTDFHTATLIGDSIFIVGGLGYSESRLLQQTPVFKLSLNSMRMDAVTTTGGCPGWLYRHKASLSDDGYTIVVSGGERWNGDDRNTFENVDDWIFDTREATWSRLTARDWQQWVMRRVDKKPNRIWHVRSAKWSREYAHLGMSDFWNHADEPDFVSLEQLYKYGGEPPEQGDNAGEYHIHIDGLKVRIKEDSFCVSVVVEGRLSPEHLTKFKTTTLSLLERIDGAAYEIEDDGLCT